MRLSSTILHAFAFRQRLKEVDLNELTPTGASHYLINEYILLLKLWSGAKFCSNWHHLSKFKVRQIILEVVCQGYMITRTGIGSIKTTLSDVFSTEGDACCANRHPVSL